MRQLDIILLDEFLDYHLETHHENNFTRFSRFLVLTMRNFASSLLTPEQEQTVKEWIEQKKEVLKITESPDEKTGKIKGRPQRTADDQLTALNQELTVLLLHYLKKSNAFFQGDYLNNKQAGQALYILTGYSADAIRQKLSNSELEQINSKKNLADLHIFLTNLCILIHKEIKR